MLRCCSNHSDVFHYWQHQGRIFSIFISSPSTSDAIRTSPILQSIVAYFIGRTSVGYFGFAKKKWPRILHFPELFRGEPPPHSVEKGHFCVSVNTTTPRPALHNPTPHVHTSLQQRCDSGVAMFLQAITGELLPTFCKGWSTLFPTKKAVYDEGQMDTLPSIQWGWMKYIIILINPTP